MYRSQGQNIHDKHFEVIIRKMMSKVIVTVITSYSIHYTKLYEGILIDEQGMVLYHPDQTLVGTEYPFEVSLVEPVFDPNHTASDGTREMLYSYPVPGRSWAIITTLPVSVPQQAALELSLSLLVMLVALMFVLFVV